MKVVITRDRDYLCVWKASTKVFKIDGCWTDDPSRHDLSKALLVDDIGSVPNMLGVKQEGKKEFWLLPVEEYDVE